MRVLHILESFEHAGAGRQAALLADGLPREEFDVHVCALGFDGPLAWELRACDVPVMAMDRRWRLDPAAFWRLRRHVSRLRPDIVHTWEFAANTYGRLVGNSNGCGLVASERRIDLWKRWPQERIDGWLMSRTARFVASCNAVRDFYLLRSGFWRPDRLSVIHPAVTPPRSDVAPRREFLADLDLPEDAILFAAIGSLSHAGRVKDMIWAVEMLGVLFPELHLLIVGDGPQRRSLETFSRCCRRAHLIRFLGRRDAREIWPHLDGLWHVGEEDGLSSTLLEAMAAGIPVVASDTPGNRELVRPGETGWLVPLGDRPGLARCTQILLRNRDAARQIGEAARRYVTDHFSLSDAIDQHADLYRELAAPDRRGNP